MATIKPLGNRVLIKRFKSKATRGGILLPESAQEKPKEGEVVAVGEGAINENGHKHKLSVSVGDKILFSSYAGTEINNESEDELLILTEDEILGILQ